ncbi:MAG: dienelactone hydrolase [Myxococcota bacterium]
MYRITALVSFCLASFVLGCGYMTEVLVKQAVPAFPELPKPVDDLANGASGLIYFNTTTPFDLDVLLDNGGAGLPTTGVGTLFMPRGGEAPYPAMVLLHGSGGISPGREMEYGQMLSQNGVAAFILNYYLPRGVTDETDYMVRVLSVTEFDAIADAYAALHLLATHPAIDGQRIGVGGYSYGGMAARFAMDERIRQALAPDHSGFAAFVDYYGPCFQRLNSTKTNGAPLLTLRGTEDASNDLSACADREAEMQALGVEVEAHVYQGAGHAWEVNSPKEMHPEAPYLSGCEVVYDNAGRSSVNGKPVVDVAVETPRMERILMRASSGDQMKECVKSGYVIGRDDETKAKSDATLLNFLRRHLSSS